MIEKNRMRNQQTKYRDHLVSFCCTIVQLFGKISTFYTLFNQLQQGNWNFSDAIAWSKYRRSKFLLTIVVWRISGKNTLVLASHSGVSMKITNVSFAYKKKVTFCLREAYVLYCYVQANGSNLIQKASTFPIRMQESQGFRSDFSQSLFMKMHLHEKNEVFYSIRFQK